MTIKELFEHERLYTASVIDSYEHNRSIDRIEAKVTERIKELEELVESYERIIEASKNQYIPDRIEAAIKELEAQVPKVVKPTLKRHVSGPYYLCTCDTVLDGIAHFNFCPWCGAKLDWEDK